MEQEKKTSVVWKYLAIVLVAVTIALVVALFSLSKSKLQAVADAAETQAVTIEETVTETMPETESVVELTPAEAAKEYGDSILTYWTDTAVTKNQLISYMAEITDESNPNFIPVKNRIAVFDFDGTLFCETDPNYFDYTLLVHRVLEDETYKDQASKYEKQTAEKIVEQNEKGTSFKGLETDHGKCIASSFAGMTLGEFNDYIQEFKKTPMPSYDGMLRGDGWYLPMLQIIDYLKANDFTVYIISGTDRFIVRGIVDGSVLDLPMSQVIGSDESLVASGQGDEDGLTYQFTAEDKLITGGEFIIKNLKMNKVSVIAKEIGEQPVLSFGNSTGDASMAEYVITNNPYKSLAFMLCCDDLERENGNIEKADKMYSLCTQNGWIPVSMKNDWTTIYGDNVTKKISEEVLQKAS